MRVLYLQTTPVPPPKDESIDRFELLSPHLEGAVLHPLWFTEPAEVEKEFGPGSWPTMDRGRFRYHWFLWKLTGWRKQVGTFRFYISEALKIHKENPIDVVMTYSHMTTALCGVVIKVLTGARLVVEVVCEPSRVYLRERPKPRLVDRLRSIYSDLCLHISLWACDCTHLLYPEQIARYPLLRGVRRAAFNEYVPIKAVPRHAEGPRYIILVGAPWYRKGADLLIDAFRRLAPDFLDVELRIMGYFPDKAQLEALIRDCPRVVLTGPLPNEKALRMIADSAVFVLPSREEGMGRVLLEAMAAGVPVVGAAVGGIPTLVRHGVNGFLFPEENVDELEACLRRLLSDRELTEKMGAAGYEMAHGEFSIDSYVGHFVRMMRLAAGKD